MQGFKPRDQRDNQSKKQSKQKKANLGFANGGMIRGPGTGTSDDIEAEMPAGSYVMPADSTEQIGEEGLASMGSPADVRVSNGEYQLPPEQVHAIGVQALDQMKDATHTPVAQGFNPQVNRDGEQFFNQGGVTLGDEEAKRKAAQMQNQSPIAPPPQSSSPAASTEQLNAERANRLGAQKEADTAMRSEQRKAGARAIENTKSNVSAAVDSIGGFVGDTYKNVLNAATVVPRTAYGIATGGIDPHQPARHPGADIVDANKAKLAEQAALSQQRNQQFSATMGGAQSQMDAVSGLFPNQKPAASGTPMQALEASQPVAETGTPIAQEQSGQQPASEQSAAQQSVTSQEPLQPQNAGFQAELNNVTRDGNSFSGGIVRPGYTINGQAQGGVNVMPAEQSAQNKQAVANLFERTPEFGTGTAPIQQQAQGFTPNGGGGQRFTVVGDNSRQDADYRKAFNAASTAHRGAQNGQLTAAQLRSMEGLTKNKYGTADANQSNATSRANSDSTNSANILQTNMREAGSDRRASATNNLDNRRLDQAERLSAPQIQAAEEKQSLYKRFNEAETEEQKSEILNQMRILNGSGGSQENLRNNFMQLGGGQEMVDGVLRNVPQRLIDLRTGQEVLGGQQEQKPDTKRFEKNKIYRDKSGTRFMWDGEKAVPVN
ncbi:hypothetical protein DARTUKUTA_56 [Bacillus phage vB_BspP_Dartukuta]|nr:hypothetical protein DARTUKUTA_56 [Bacillus phage vB_BspP_Dartukuta]